MIDTRVAASCSLFASSRILALFLSWRCANFRGALCVKKYSFDRRLHILACIALRGRAPASSSAYLFCLFVFLRLVSCERVCADPVVNSALLPFPTRVLPRHYFQCTTRLNQVTENSIFMRAPAGVPLAVVILDASRLVCSQVFHEFLCFRQVVYTTAGRPLIRGEPVGVLIVGVSFVCFCSCMCNPVFRFIVWYV